MRRAALLIQLLLLPPKGLTQVGELLLQIARLLHGVARLRVIESAQLQLMVEGLRMLIHHLDSAEVR